MLCFRLSDPGKENSESEVEEGERPSVLETAAGHSLSQEAKGKVGWAMPLEKAFRQRMGSSNALRLELALAFLEQGGVQGIGVD